MKCGTSILAVRCSETFRHRGSGSSRRRHRHRPGVVISLMAGRRFPPPWSVEERPACFIVNDASGQARLLRGGVRPANGC